MLSKIRAAGLSVGQFERAAVELVRDWRTDRMLRRLEAMLIVADKHKTLLLFRFFKQGR